MDRLAAGRDDAVVDRLLGQGMAPPVAPRVVGVLLEQLLGDRRLEGRLRHGLVGLRYREQERVVEAPADHGARLEHGDLVGVEPSQALLDRVAHGFRNGRVGQRRAGQVLIGRETRYGVVQHLLEEERIPLAALVEELDQLGLDRTGPGHRCDHLGDPGAGQRGELDHLRQAGAPPGSDHRQERVAAVELVAAIRHQDERPHPPQPPGQMVE